MNKITSKTESPLRLPDGQTIPPLRTVAVNNWEALKKHQVVATWVEMGILEEQPSKEPKAEEHSTKETEKPPIAVKTAKKASRKSKAP